MMLNTFGDILIKAGVGEGLFQPIVNTYYIELKPYNPGSDRQY